MDEYQAIECMRNGDIGGLEVLVRRYQVRAIRAAYLVTREVSIAEDVVQSAFLRAYERIDQLDTSRPFGPWFLASVLHDAMKTVNRRNRHTSFELLSPAGVDPTDTARLPEQVWENAETADEIWDALAVLAPAQRSAVVARYYLGLSQAEMAQALCCTESSVKWRLHAARARLRFLLAPILSND
jgi:RNA polymerase sigma-70 factor, ECF subfamily